VLLSLFHDNPPSASYAERFEKERVLERLRSLDAKVRRDGPAILDPAKDLLARIGTESDETGLVTKYSYGVFNLSWQAQRHPEWAQLVTAEVREIQQRIRERHNKPLRFLVWAGMGGSAEDKSMYNAAGLLRRGVRCYVLDSTDPSKLKHILEDMRKRSGLTTADVLRSSLVVGMAMGMTSYEPVINLEKLAALYRKHGIDSRPNFLYMTLPGSLLDRFAHKHGYRRVELQLDNGNTTAGRHSSPLTRGSLYPLALCRADLRGWIEGTFLSDEEIRSAWRLSAFIHAQGKAGRDKLTLLLPKPWAGASIWTKQNFEESLGKCEKLGLKIVIEDRPKLANYRSPKDPLRQRSFFAVQMKGARDEEARKVSLLRRSGYPVAVLALPEGTPLSRYMQFIHYAVFGVAYLREMNFVTQPGVELYKAITNRIYSEARNAGGIDKSRAWLTFMKSDRRIEWRGAITLHHSHAGTAGNTAGMEAPQLYAHLVKQLHGEGKVDYAELTFFGDMRYSPRGRRMRTRLDRAAESLFRSRLKLPVDIYEGPAMNHSYHEMIIGHGRCFSTVLIADRQEALPAAEYTADYHRAQFLATQLALAERGRPVVAVTVKDLEEDTLKRLDEFFHQAAAYLKAARI
jgi:glucose-6-phosphate isomerase